MKTKGKDLRAAAKKRIRSKRQFCLAVLATVLAAVCTVIALMDGGNMRYFLSGAILIALAVVNYYYAYNKKGVEEEIMQYTDERDRYIAMKSCQTMVQIVNYVLLGLCMVSLILYGAFRLSVFLIVAGTLCGVQILMFVTTLAINVHLEHRL